MPLGSSSAAPVIRPGPSCFTRGSSVRLFISFTIAYLRGEPMQSAVHARRDGNRGFAPPALVGTAPGQPGAIELSAAAADAALTTTRTTTHKVDLYCPKR